MILDSRNLEFLRSDNGLFKMLEQLLLKIFKRLAKILVCKKRISRYILTLS